MRTLLDMRTRPLLCKSYANSLMMTTWDLGSSGVAKGHGGGGARAPIQNILQHIYMPPRCPTLYRIWQQQARNSIPYYHSELDIYKSTVHPICFLSASLIQALPNVTYAYIRHQVIHDDQSEQKWVNSLLSLQQT